MRRWWMACVVAVSLLGAAAKGDEYPLGVVIGPSNNQQPSREEQQFYYKWAAQLGFNAIEHEMMPVAGGWLDWAIVHPAPDRFDFTAYDAAIDDAEAAGLDVYPEIFPWKHPPKWLFEEYPDLYMQTPLAGRDELTKLIRDEKLDTNTVPSLAHPELGKAVEAFVTAIAKRYKDRQRVRGYIIAEELGLSGIWPPMSFYGIDFSPAMRDAYHAHLKAKFKTIDALNEAWQHPGRYKDFSEIVWRRGWAHEPKQYRGEWMEYYRCLQRVMADYHNRVARAIKAVDPDAVVILSAYDTVGNRVGHGSYLPLFKDCDASAYKSYWQDNRWNVDLNSSGGHQAWCSNFTEAETTRGGIKQRYLAPRYIRRQFFPAYARGLKGAFLFVFTGSDVEKMSLLEPQPDGSLEPIPAVQTTQLLSRFLREHHAELAKFEPDPPRIVVLDPNTTFIGQHWDYADVTKERVQWHDQLPAIQSYISTLGHFARLNRRFEVATDEALEATLSKPTASVLCIADNDLIDASVVPVIRKWIESGKPVIADNRTGQFTEISQPSQALAGLLGRSNVLTLHGEKWFNDAAQVQRLRSFLDQHLPLRYRSTNDAGPETFTVDYMSAPDGQELAAIARIGPMGQLSRKLEIELHWTKPHAKLTLLDPFSVGAGEKRETAAGGAKSSVVLEGFQDVLLVVAK